MTIGGWPSGDDDVFPALRVPRLRRARRQDRKHLVLLAGLLVAILAAGCGGDDDEPSSATATQRNTTTSVIGNDEATSTSEETATTATVRNTTTSMTGNDEATPTSHESATTASGTGNRPVEAEEVAFEDLRRDPDALIGHTVEVEGKVFFEVTCPPPPPGGQAGPCSLNGFLAAKEVTFLGPAEVRDAFRLMENGQLVSCVDAEGTGACAGWENGRLYRLVATVERRPLGSQAHEIALDVSSRTPL